MPVGEMTGYVMSGSWLAPLVRAVESYGVDAKQLISDELSGKSIGQMVHAQIGYDSITRMWRRAAVLTNEPAIGIVAARHIGPNTFGPLSFAMYSSNSALTALNTFSNYSQFGTNVAVWWCHQTEEYVEVVRHGRAGTGAEEMKDAVPAAILNMCQSLGNPTLRPDRLVLGRKRPRDTSKWRSFFGLEPEFHVSGRTLMRFPLEAVTENCPSYEPELFNLCVSLLDQKLKELSTESFIGLVRVQIIKSIEDGEIHIDTAARDLGLSRRTLQRRLDAENNCTFSDLLGSIRDSMAKRYLAESTRSIGEISESLCYSSVSSFSRSFRNRFNMTPSGYRRQAISRQIFLRNSGVSDDSAGISS
jgi:AraC-like DNA-binding protein